MRPQRKIRTSMNYDHTENKGEQYTLPSLTTPDMSMTVRELAIRYAQGLPLKQNPNLVYTGDTLLPDVRKMDLVEYEQAIKANEERIERRKAELKQFEEVRKQRRANKEYNNPTSKPQAVVVDEGAIERPQQQQQ